MSNLSTACIFLSLLSGCADSSQPPSLPDCVWCGAQDAPDVLASTMRIASQEEPGTRLHLSGILVDKSNQPIAGALIYAYHTDATGTYRKEGNETSNGNRHGTLRGWLKTGNDGTFTIDTIQPAPYPDHTEPAHIHITVKPKGQPEIPVHPLWFKGDPRLTQEMEEAIQLPANCTPILTLIPSEEGGLKSSFRLMARSTMP